MRHTRIGVVVLLAWLAGTPLSAATGWYLLEPVLNGTPTDAQMARKYPHWAEFDKWSQRDLLAEASLEFSAPLSRWAHKGSFDTANECQRERQHAIDVAKKSEVEFDKEKYPNGMPTLVTHLAIESRCIASDDPRLAAR